MTTSMKRCNRSVSPGVVSYVGALRTDRTPDTTYDACAAACEQLDDCNSWSWQYSAQSRESTCALLDEVPEQDEGEPNTPSEGYHGTCDTITPHSYVAREEDADELITTTLASDPKVQSIRSKLQQYITILNQRSSDCRHVSSIEYRTGDVANFVRLTDTNGVSTQIGDDRGGTRHTRHLETDEYVTKLEWRPMNFCGGEEGVSSEYAACGMRFTTNKNEIVMGRFDASASGLQTVSFTNSEGLHGFVDVSARYLERETDVVRKRCYNSAPAIASHLEVLKGRTGTNPEPDKTLVEQIEELDASFHSLQDTLASLRPCDLIRDHDMKGNVILNTDGVTSAVECAQMCPGPGFVFDKTDGRCWCVDSFDAERGDAHASYVSGRTCDYYVPHEPRCVMENGRYVAPSAEATAASEAARNMNTAADASSAGAEFAAAAASAAEFSQAALPDTCKNYDEDGNFDIVPRV